MRFDPLRFDFRHQLLGLFALFLLTGSLLFVVDSISQYHARQSLQAMKDDVLPGIHQDPAPVRCLWA